MATKRARKATPSPEATKQPAPLPSTNGAAKPRRRVKPVPQPPEAEPSPAPAAPPAPPAAPAPDPPGYGPGNSRAGAGRLASDVIPRAPAWLIPDLVARDTLTFVVGDPDVGKSTLGAWLCSKARRPAILPGWEESVEVMLIARLRANQVNLHNTLLLDDRHWVLPGDRQQLTERLRAHGCDLLWIDPVDSYLNLRSENDPESVRAGLESLAKLASELRMPVVAARHPGKTAGNWCRGSYAWRAVPKVILALTKDDGPPPRRFLRPWKPGPVANRLPREYTLLGELGEPLRFSLGPQVSAEEADVIASYDPIERTMLENATELLKDVLAESRQPSALVRSLAEREGIKDTILRRAARRLGYRVERTGQGTEHVAYWVLPDSGTPALTQRHPPLPESTPEKGGVRE